MGGDPDYKFPEAVTLNRTRTAMGVPLLREGEIFGVIALTRDYVEPFSERQVGLARTFADQAVIAMENARLLGELTRREHELRVTFDHMGDGVVMFDADLKLVSWNRNFQELLDISDSFLAGRPDLGDYVRLLVERGELGDDDVESTVVRYSERVNEAWSNERIRPDGRVIEVRNNPVPGGGAVLIYSDITRRKKAEEEIRAARDAAEAALERQTATAEILNVIASSPTDVRPVLKAIVESACELCEAYDAAVLLRDGEDLRFSAHHGPIPIGLQRWPINRRWTAGRAFIDRKPVHIHDLRDEAHAEFTDGREMSLRMGHRSILSVPLLREGESIGSIVLRRTEVHPFSDKQIALLQTFADQAVIAIGNVRLFEQVQERTKELSQSLDDLRTAQDRLDPDREARFARPAYRGHRPRDQKPAQFCQQFRRPVCGTD